MGIPYVYPGLTIMMKYADITWCSPALLMRLDGDMHEVKQHGLALCLLDVLLDCVRYERSPSDRFSTSCTNFVL